jgi:RecG-like helicase
MAKESTGYIGKGKQGKWFARVTLTGTCGKRRNIARRTASKPEARQILKAILRRIESEGEKVIDTARLIQAGLEKMREMEEQFGAENLVYGDVEWGIMQGKMAALAWVMGTEWEGAFDT